MRKAKVTSKRQQTDVDRVHPGTLALKGTLRSAKGKELTIAQIREAAEANVLIRQ